MKPNQNLKYYMLYLGLYHDAMKRARGYLKRAKRGTSWQDIRDDLRQLLRERKFAGLMFWRARSNFAQVMALVAPHSPEENTEAEPRSQTTLNQGL